MRAQGSVAVVLLFQLNLTLRLDVGISATLVSPPDGGYGGLGWDAKQRQGMPNSHLAPRPNHRLAPCPAKPCPHHPGRTFCSSDPSPGQCDRTSHPPCPPCENPSPPPPSPRLGPTCSTGNLSQNHICPGPNYHGCLNATARALGYCNTSLSTEARIEDLIGRLGLKDQIAMISPQSSWGFSTCACFTPSPKPRSNDLVGNERIGLPTWMWLTEANSGSGGQCVAKGKCATVFVGAQGMAASFNRSSWRHKGLVTGKETRAFVNSNSGSTGNGPLSLSGYGPNLNILRDPRFGRASEDPSEDPYLAGHYASEWIKGSQQKDANGEYALMITMLKHFAAYSQEHNRGGDDYLISQHDLFETYLAQYEIAFVEGRASGAMCAYTGVNGSPMCSNGKILNGVLRGLWNRSDALITTDCGAVGMMQHQPANAPGPEYAAAWALNNGTDIEMGDIFYYTQLETAISKGLTTKEAVKRSVRRSLKLQFDAGRFDPLGDSTSNPWTHIGQDVINSTEHQRVLKEAALQSYVLLKNRIASSGPTLPLTKGAKVVVLGPQAFSRGIFGDYSNGPCAKDDPDCSATIAEAIGLINAVRGQLTFVAQLHCYVGGNTTGAFGVDVTIPVNATNASSCDRAIFHPHDLNATSSHGGNCISHALSLIDFNTDAVVLVIGIDGNIEHENVDRVDTAPPGLQMPFAQAVLKKATAQGTPVVLVMAGIGTLAVDELVDGASAIIEAFALGHTAVAFAETLFGVHNRWGKLPVTIYPHAYIKEQAMTNYDMSKFPGRTYKYYTGKPLWGFGMGLSYTSFELSCSPVNNDSMLTSEIFPRDVSLLPLFVTCNVTNTGKVAGDEVVMVYHRVSDAVRAVASKLHPVPKRALVQFERVTVAPRESQIIHFPPFEQKSFELVNAEGNRTLYPGQHSLIFSRGHGAQEVINVSLTA